jgi:1-acyl-sn-glycerol-3-phosphate acyltransferase
MSIQESEDISTIAAESNGAPERRAALDAPSSSAAQLPTPRTTFLSIAARLWYAMLWGPCYAISQVWFRYRFSGKGSVPITGPVLLVSNHQSHLDPVLVGLACPRQLKFLARQGLFFWPFSWWIRALGAVPIDRNRGSFGGIRTTVKLLKEGEAVVVFPEGSRTPDGKMRPLLPGFCLLARRSGATIVPVAINGAFAAMPRGSFLVRPHRIVLAFGRPIRPDDCRRLTDKEVVELTTQEIVRALRTIALEGKAQR